MCILKRTIPLAFEITGTWKKTMFIQIQNTECAVLWIHIIGTSMFFSFLCLMRRGRNLFIPHSNFVHLKCSSKNDCFYNELFQMIKHRESIQCILTLEQALTFWSTINVHLNDLLCFISSCFP